MNESCSPDLKLEHERRISIVEERSKSNTHRLNEHSELLDVMRDMNTNVSLIAQQTQSILDTVRDHEMKIDSIEEKMETKDTVQRLHKHLDAMEISHQGELDSVKVLIKELEGRPTVETQNAEIGKKLIFWLIFVFVLGTLVLFVVAVILAMIKQAAFPEIEAIIARGGIL